MKRIVLIDPAMFIHKNEDVDCFNRSFISRFQLVLPWEAGMHIGVASSKWGNVENIFICWEAL